MTGKLMPGRIGGKGRCVVTKPCLWRSALYALAILENERPPGVLRPSSFGYPVIELMVSWLGSGAG
jgi:hypothetical protein